MEMSAQGTAALPSRSTTCQAGAGTQAANGRQAEPGNDGDNDRVGDEAAEDQQRRCLPALGEDRRQRHGDGQMHGDQHEERHGARFAIGLQDHRHADEDRVGLTGRETGHDLETPVRPKKRAADRCRQRPDHRDADEIGDPVAPWLHRRNIRANEGSEDQAGQGELEDEFRQAFAGAFRDEASPSRQ